MIEILTMGDIEKDFERLDVEVRQTYKSDEYGVCEVTEEEFKKLCDEPEDVDGVWKECGWRYAEGSNQKMPVDKVIINNRPIIAWSKKNYTPDGSNLLVYLCEEMKCSQPRNVCALTTDLAIANEIKLSELFEKYQG